MDVRSASKITWVSLLEDWTSVGLERTQANAYNATKDELIKHANACMHGLNMFSASFAATHARHFHAPSHAVQSAVVKVEGLSFVDGPDGFEDDAGDAGAPQKERLDLQVRVARVAQEDVRSAWTLRGRTHCRLSALKTVPHRLHHIRHLLYIRTHSP